MTTTEPTVYATRPIVRCPYCGRGAKLGQWKGVFVQQRGRVDLGDGATRTRLMCVSCGLTFPLIEEPEDEEIVSGFCHSSGKPTSEHA